MGSIRKTSRPQFELELKNIRHNTPRTDLARDSALPGRIANNRTATVLRLLPHPSESEADADDRRSHRRLSRAELVAPPTIRIPRRPAVSLVDLSSGGVLIEAPFQLRPGSRMTIEMLTSAERLDMPLRLLRCYLSELKHGPRYRAACEFEQALRIPALHRQAAPPVEPRLLEVLEQFQKASLASEPTSSVTRFAELLGWVVNASRGNEPRSLIAARIEAHLRQLFPTLVICNRSWLSPKDPSLSSQFFDLEFRSETRLTRSDRQFLRACAQLINLLGGSSSSAVAASADPYGVSVEIPESDIARTGSEWIEMCRKGKTLA